MVALLITSSLHSTVPSPWQVQMPPPCSQDSPSAWLTSSSSRHRTSGASVMITKELHSGLPPSQLQTRIFSPVFSSHRAPSLHLLPSSQLARSPQSRLVQPGRPPARHRQLLQPSGLQESPSCLATPVSLSLPQPSPGWGRFWGSPATKEETEKTKSALLTIVICCVISSPLQSV